MLKVEESLRKLSDKGLEVVYDQVLQLEKSGTTGDTYLRKLYDSLVQETETKMATWVVLELMIMREGAHRFFLKQEAERIEYDRGIISNQYDFA